MDTLDALLPPEANRPELTCLDLARNICEKLLHDPKALPLQECYRLMGRLRQLPSNVPLPLSNLARRPLIILSGLARPGVDSGYEDFDPLDLHQNETWPRVAAQLAHGLARHALRECLELLKAAMATPGTATTPSGLPLPPPIGDQLWSVHYLCESFKSALAANRTPRVFAVGVFHCMTGQVQVFAAHRVAERRGCIPTHDTVWENEGEVLRETGDFFKVRHDAQFIHCGMHSANYGFEALAQRHLTLLGSPMSLPRLENRFDLTGYLKRRHGETFVRHPHFHSLIALNRAGGLKYLTPDEERSAWDRGDWEKVGQAVEARAEAIDTLFRRYVRGQLQTDLGVVGLTVAPSTGSPLDSLEPSHPEQDRRTLPEQTDPASRAIALLLAADREGRKTTVKEIANASGCSRATLYRDQQFRAARRALKAKKEQERHNRKTARRGGFRDAEGNVDARSGVEEE
jgi:hypothetical protein